MAMAEAHLAAVFNRPKHGIVDHYTYAIVTDGDLMEGIASEAASLAGHLRLDKIVFLYDDNRISIDGSTDVAFTENVGARFEAYGWHIQHVDDGNDVNAIDKAIEVAKKDSRPSLILCRTHIGYGAPNKQDTASSHGSPLGKEELDGAKKNLGWPTEPHFHVPDDVLEHFREAVKRGAKIETEWKSRLDDYRRAHPALAAELERRMAGKLPDGWDTGLVSFPADPKGLATRASSGKVINALASHLPELISGSADLTGSNKTWIDDGSDSFQADRPENRNIFFGVREHAMGAAVNGMVAHGGLKPYCGTFLVFADYMRPAIRISALSKHPSIWIFTHDSIGLGEDGPTPLTRQNLPTLDRSVFNQADGLARGAYVLRDLGKGDPQVILMASGSEVELIIAAGEQLAAEGMNVRLVSFPCWELFENQDKDYRESVLPARVGAKLAVEAGVSQGWKRWVGDQGGIISIDRFGASAPANVLFEKYGFSVKNVVKQARQLVGS
jgi:transketolase